jgi:tetratricopeptide (TPR) repeat protein
MAPRIVTVMRKVDRVHVVPPGTEESQILASAFGPAHLADLANLVLALTPLAVAALLMALFLWPAIARRRDLWVLAALAIPFAGMMLFIHPRQGVFRDWDIFAAGAVALSLLTAWVVGQSLAAARRQAWIGVAAVLGTFAPSAQWLIHHRDPDRGIDRVEAFLNESPHRSNDVRARAFNYLGWQQSGLNRLDASAEAHARAAELGPSPAILFEWGMAEANRGQLVRAREIFVRIIRQVPGWFEAWLNLAAVSYRMNDLEFARRAAERALSLRPADRDALHLLQTIERTQAAALGRPGAP